MRANPYIESLTKFVQHSNQEKKFTWLSILFIAPAIIFLLILFVLPSLYVLFFSFHDVSIYSVESSFLGIKNYEYLANSPNFWKIIWNTLIFSAGSVIFQIVFGLLFALAINKKFTGSSMARTLAIFPYLVPTIVVALIWKWMLSPSYGLFNSYGLKYNLIDNAIPFFGSLEFAMPVVIVAGSWKFTSFAIILFLARLQAIDRRMYEQAKISGASRFQMFTDITLPHLRSTILLVLLLRWMFMFKKFDIVWLLTHGGPLGATETLPILIYKLTFLNGDLGRGSAAAIVLFIFLIFTGIIYFGHFQPGQEIETET